MYIVQFTIGYRNRIKTIDFGTPTIPKLTQNHESLKNQLSSNKQWGKNTCTTFIKARNWRQYTFFFDRQE